MQKTPKGLVYEVGEGSRLQVSTKVRSGEGCPRLAFVAFSELLSQASAQPGLMGAFENDGVSFW